MSVRKERFALPLAAMIAAMAVAQLLFKQAGMLARTGAHWADALVFNPWLWAGLAISAVGMVCWLLTLHRMPLSVAYPWTALIYALTPLGSRWLFGEVFDSRYIVGMALIVVGISLTASSAQDT
jgi:drug/metabolite transporter (DMT)-like permease